MVHGKDIIIMIDGVAIAACKSNDLSISTDTIEIASPTSGTDKEYIAGRSSWTASSNTLVTNVPYLLSMKGKVVDVVIKSPGQIITGLNIQNGDYSGRAIIKSIQITANRTNMATGSIQLQGSGPLTKGDNFTLVNMTNYTIFCPENREATEQTFNSTVHCNLSDYNVGSGHSVAVICNGVFNKSGVTQQSTVTSFKFYNRQGTHFDETLGAFVTNTGLAKTDYPIYIDWKIDNIIGVYSVTPRVYFE